MTMPHDMNPRDSQPAAETDGMAPRDATSLDTVKVLTDLKWFIGIAVSVLLAFLGYLFAAVNGIATDLRSHKENTEVHRTREEVATQKAADAEWKEYVKESLQRIERRLDRTGR